MPSANGALRDPKTGQFTEWTPLTNPRFLQGVRTYVKAADALIPLFQSMADEAEIESPEWVYKRLIASTLVDMSSNMAGQLVSVGEQLIVRPPSDYMRGGWNWSDPNDADALRQCEIWYRAASDVQWFFTEIGIAKKPPAKVLAQAKQGSKDACFLLMAYTLCNAMDELKQQLEERLAQADDKEYLKEAKKPALRLPMMDSQ